MRHYEDRSRVVVVERECVSLRCDACGKEAPRHGDEYSPWQWQGLPRSSASTVLSARFECDDASDEDEVDLCYECATALIALARSCGRTGVGLPKVTS